MFFCTTSPNIFSLSTAFINCDQEQKQDYFSVCEAEAKEAYLEAEIFQNKEKKFEETHVNLPVTFI